MKTKNLIGIVVVIALILVVYGFVNTQTGQMVSTIETVKIGVLEPLTGPRAEAGKYVSNGLEISLREINENQNKKYKSQNTNQKKLFLDSKN